MGDKPNLLIILSDQLRRQSIGCYGDTNACTPNIDTLARSGTVFTQASSTYPVCVPFRFSLMTGQYAHTRFVPVIEWRMSPAECTLADVLNQGGYETIYVGKWHLYGGHGVLPNHTTEKASRTPVPRVYQGRWKQWYGFEISNNHWDTVCFAGDDPTPLSLSGYQTDALFHLAQEKIRDLLNSGHADPISPFCCMISVEPPHFPWSAPAALETKWRSREIELRPNFRDPEAGSSVEPGFKSGLAVHRNTVLDRIKLYYAMIENLDQNVGRLMEFLNQTGLLDNTIVMLVSDHGDLNGSHGLTAGIKHYPFEESIGIPLIVRNPRTTGQGERLVHEVVCTEDLYPTILGLAGLEPVTAVPGKDLSPLIAGETESLHREAVPIEVVHNLTDRWGAFHRSYYRGVRSSRYKYVALGGAEGAVPWLFFDLVADPYEMNNLIDRPDYEDAIAYHHRLLYRHLVESADHFVLRPAFDMPGMNTWK